MALTPRCKRITGHAGRASGRPCAPRSGRALGVMNYEVGPASWWARVTRPDLWRGLSRRFMARPRNSIGGIPVDLTHSGVHANLFNKQGVSLGEWMDR